MVRLAKPADEDGAFDLPKYVAFLSYTHRDARWGSWLHKALKSCRSPSKPADRPTAHEPVPKRLSPVFRDCEELASATDLGIVINEALRQSACQIVILLTECGALCAG